MFEVRPIAWVRSTRTALLDDDWDKERCHLELADGVPDEAIEGLEGFSHVVVVFVFDRASDVPPGPWSRHPRGNPDWPRVGILAQRAKDRPNRLGLTTCRIRSVTGRRVEVEGLDAVDGTPVLDLKPHVETFGARGEVHQPAWMDALMADYFEPRS
jgi:tRNA (adenine37-N6)-methyltransferase